MNNQYYHDLFGRLLEGKLSPEETDQLIEWLNREENAGAASDIISSQLSGAVKEEEITPDIRNALQARLPLILNAGERKEHSPVSIFRQGWFKYAAAAVLIIAIGITLWSVQNKSIPSNTTVKQGAIKKDIAPGKPGAILTLADGRQVVLDSLGNGIVAEQTGVKVMLEDGKLRYDKLPIASLPRQVGDSRLPTYNAISTPKGRQFQLVLPDGTKVWLNAASSLKYPTHFNGKERRVEITGEAYFEVAHNPNKPFIVSKGSFTVEVLGTHFNVNAYDDEPAIRTTLLEGKVKVGKGQKAEGREESVVLKPGEQASLSQSSQSSQSIPVQTVDIDKVMAWKNGLFNFNEATLQEIMHQLERWYDIEVQYEPGVPKLEFVGKMGRDLSLNNVLRGLELSKVHFRLEGRKLTVMP